MQKEPRMLSPFCADTKNVNFYENSMKPDINSIEKNVDPDHLPSKEALFSKQHASSK